MIEIWQETDEIGSHSRQQQTDQYNFIHVPTSVGMHFKVSLVKPTTLLSFADFRKKRIWKEKKNGKNCDWQINIRLHHALSQINTKNNFNFVFIYPNCRVQVEKSAHIERLNEPLSVDHEYSLRFVRRFEEKTRKMANKTRKRDNGKDVCQHEISLNYWADSSTI